MGAPSVPYEMLTDGFKVTSGPNGFRAQVSFKVLWEHAFQFHDDVMGYSSAVVIGPLAINNPWQFPGSSSARIYVSSCEITPFALEGGARSIAVAAGMAPGEFWSHARLDCTFETPTAAHSAADDPGGNKQLDPSNPIYGCEQSVRLGGKSVTRSKEDYVMAGDATKKPAEDLTVFIPEANLTLTYESVPFLAWRKYRPYVGTLNNATFLDCPTGTLMFEGADIQPNPSSRGTMAYSMTLNLAYSEEDWNKAPHPVTGTYDFVQKATGGKKLYNYMNFSGLLL
jgi:hypothetical protein